MTEVVIVGEAWGEQEEKAQTAFVGAAGYELTRMLDEAGLRRADCYITNVFNLRPADNKIEALCGPKQEGIRGYPALVKSGYVRKEFIPELNRLADEIVEHNPNLIIALGNTPLWALGGRTGINKYRGVPFLSTHTAIDYKVLATYHPAGLFRQWNKRPIAIADLIKAKREAQFPEIRRPPREIWIEPSIEDIEEFYNRYINVPPYRVAVDIETVGDQVTCIGFAPTHRIALVIPFYDSRRKGRNYWPDRNRERLAWDIVKRILLDENIKKTFQNGAYDIAFLWRSMGLKTYGADEDTMLLHHSLQPESLKSLGFLGSIYTDEGAWKIERKGTSTIKKDE